VISLGDAGCPTGQVLRDRSAGDRDDLEQAARGGREAVEAGEHELLERDLAGVAVAAARGGVADQLLDEQRVALALDGDAGGLGEGRGSLRPMRASARVSACLWVRGETNMLRTSPRMPGRS
jgi:hypothetical protein